MLDQTLEPIDKAIKSLQDFLRYEASGGLVLMGAALAAMLIANSPLSDFYLSWLSTPIAVSVGSFAIAKPLLLWVNDGLMAVFFFLVGLELKRELLDGHLSTFEQAILPAVAAIGGMFVPAAIFAALNWGDPVAIRGWAVPTATDIAFALGVLTLLGNRVPAALKAFLLSVAIFDDLGAIIVIAIFYTESLSITSLSFAAAFISVLFVLNRLNVQKPAAYLLIGIALWIAVLKSGVHATLAGVAVALFIPMSAAKGNEPSENQPTLLESLESALHPWVAFFVLPVFAFANAGVPLFGISLDEAFTSLPLGIVAGLFFGKQIGILGFSWVAVRLGFAARPERVSWSQLWGTSLLCGIGFTMSLFVASLAFDQQASTYQGLDRLGIVVGSCISGLLGYWILRKVLPKTSAE